MTFAVFGQTLGDEFINYDDNDYVYNNPVVAGGLTPRGMAWAFDGAHAYNWHPLTWLSHELDCTLYGLHPWGHHLSNVIIHTAAVIALFLVLRNLTGAFWRSAFVAAVFAIHPLRVESVAWVAERKDVLSGLFFILTIGAYARYARLPWSWARYALALFLFALALMSKPMVVTLPVVLLLLDYWPLRRKEPAKQLILEKLPLLALSIVCGVITVLAQRGAIQATDSFPLPLRFANAVASCAIYLTQMVWPARLAVAYPYPHDGLPAWEVVLCGILLAGLSAAAWVMRRKQPWLLMGWLWYLVMLLPVIGLVQTGLHAHADRFTYLPQIGIYLAVVWLAAQWQLSRAASARLMSVTLAALMVCAWKQAAFWKDSVTLWNRALACTTRNDEAYYNLGVVSFEKGRMDEAISDFQAALRIRRDFLQASDNLGLAYLQAGRVDDAMSQFEESLRLDSRSAISHNGLGTAFGGKGRMDDAIAEFQKAVELEPGMANFHFNLAKAFMLKGRNKDAAGQFQEALQIDPALAEARQDLETVLNQK